MRRFQVILFILISTTLIFISVLSAREQTKMSDAQAHPVVVGNSTQQDMTPFPHDEATQKIIAQEQILSDGDLLRKQGRYEEAIAKYKEALQPSLLNNEGDKTGPIGRIIRIYKMQGKYKEALQELQWFIDYNPKGTGWLDEKLEFEALIKAHNTNSPEPVYEHIRYLREKYKNQLPPKVGIYPPGVPSTIIRLCDLVGDYDTGVAFVEEFLKYYAKRGPGNPYQPKNPYFQIKQAFLQDKAKGTRGGATKVLIQSDYFPW